MYSACMGWESIDDKLNPLNAKIGNSPTAASSNPPALNPLSGSKPQAPLGPSLGAKHIGHDANQLDQSLENGRVNIYTDDTHASERVEIQVPNGLIAIYKDYDLSPDISHYKSIEMLDKEMQVIGKIDLDPIDKHFVDTGYRCFFDGTEIGKGNGDIGLLVAQKIIGETMQPRSGPGSAIDDEIIKTIKKVLNLE